MTSALVLDAIQKQTLIGRKGNADKEKNHPRSPHLLRRRRNRHGDEGGALGTDTSKQAQKSKQRVSKKPDGVRDSKHGPRQGALKPCPFCGGKRLTRMETFFSYVLCTRCGAEGPTVYNNMKAACTLWNKRSKL